MKSVNVKMTRDPVAAGMTALSCGDWVQARAHFEAALGTEETAQALDGLSEALYWLDEVGASLELRTRAYALYREHGDVRQAVRAALWLAWGHIGSRLLVRSAGRFESVYLAIPSQRIEEHYIRPRDSKPSGCWGRHGLFR